MALERKSKRIGEHTYHVTQLGALKGSKVLARLLKILQPMQSGDPAKAIEAADDATLEFIRDSFLPRTELELPGGKSIAMDTDLFDLHFAGNYAEMIGWLLFCVEVNFGKVFTGAGNAKEASPAKK